MIKRFFQVLVFFTAAGSLWAQTNGKRPDFSDTHAQAMAGATVSLFDNGFGIYGNPASLNQKSKTYDIVGTLKVAALEGIGIGIADTFTSEVSASIMYHGLSPLGATNLTDQNTSHHAALNLSYFLLKRLSFGLGASLYKGPYYGNTNVFFGFTPGLVLDLSPITFGAMWRDVLTLNDGGLPSVLSFGASFNNLPVTISLQGDYQFGKPSFPDNVLSLRGGLEFRLPKYVAFTGGYHNDFLPNTSKWENHSVGVGVEYFSEYHRFYIADEFNVSKVENTFSISYRFTPKF